MQISLNAKAIWVLFIILIAGMMGTQAVWTLATYLFQKDRMQKQVSEFIMKSIDNEAQIRMSQMRGDHKEEFENEGDSTFVIYSSEDTVTFDRTNSPEMLKTEVFQVITERRGYPFRIDSLDSLLNGGFQRYKIESYIICYMDSGGTIFEQRGNPLLLNDKDAFRSDSIPIVNGNKVQIVAQFGMQTAIKTMLIGLSSFSFILMFTVGFIAFLLTRRLLTEKKLNHFRNDFVNAFTHNMKTPLSQVLTTLENINGEKYNARPDLLKKHGNLAFLSVYKIQRQIEQMLAISRSEADNLMLNRADTDIRALVEGLKARFEILKTKPVSIESSYSPEHLTAYIDRQLIEDVVSNLVDNAIKYSDESVNIQIDCSVKDNYLIIKVKDNGFGISEEDRTKIFEKYERGAAFGRQDGAKGFGLGLNYVRRVVLAHSGKIQLISMLGQGSEFIVILPVK
ncbi:MAG: HAMP domain-containing histidine kinase [Tannerella sp.]|jgi:two-component system phosphate regulon sensor histidine kinase PhoR|nr:HAMP domain-containing histidine kinase [Tannerella sp.]